MNQRTVAREGITMRFRVGPWVYRIVISDGQLLDEQGAAREGLCVWSDRTIWISGALALEQRVEVLFHELAHAWEHHFGTPADAEGMANQSSSFATDVWNQLQRQGGAWMLARLKADGVAVADGGTPNTSYAVSCGQCGTMVAIGSVRTSPAMFDAQLACPVVHREFTCEHCDTVQSWTEGITPGGKPNGVVLNGPTIGKPLTAAG